MKALTRSLVMISPLASPTPAPMAMTTADAEEHPIGIALHDHADMTAVTLT